MQVLQETIHQNGSLGHTNYMTSHYGVKFISFIPLKHHHFSTQSPNKLMQFTHLGTHLKIPLQQKTGFCICNHSLTATSTSSLL